MLFYIYKVKFLSVIFFILYFSYSKAQQPFTPPAAVANSYTFTDKDGYTDFNYATIYHAPSGKVYTKTYDGHLVIHGNNYRIPLPSISNEGVLAGYFYEVNKNEAWYYDSKKIVVLRNDTVHRIVRLPKEFMLYAEINGSLVYINNMDGFAETYVFLGKEFVKKPLADDLKLKFDGATYFSGKAFYLSATTADSLFLYKILPSNFTFKKVATYALGNTLIREFTDELNFKVQRTDKDNAVLVITNGQIIKTVHNRGNEYIIPYGNAEIYPYGLIKMEDGYRQIINLTQPANRNLFIISEDHTNLLDFENHYGSLYASTGNKPMRIFNTIKKYPTLFNNSNSNGIFSLRQDEEGDIWAGSYNKGISIISQKGVRPLASIEEKITNGGSAFKKNMYLLVEGFNPGLYRINRNEKISRLTKGMYGFFTYISKDSNYFYIGTGGHKGLWRTPTAQLENDAPLWDKIDSSRGTKLLNILTITEDTVGRIWCGHSKRGVMVYDPKKNSAKTWLTEKNEIAFGAYASVTDAMGTVWMGSGTNGLWYYKDYSQEPSPLSCKKINHPLLGNTKALTALTIYKSWLVISGYDKMMLLNLDSFYQKNKIILRYLNPQEAAFTSFTEQNTSFTSVTDSTVWFSTGDMLYQWDIKKWLSLPQYKVAVTTRAEWSNKQLVLLLNKNNLFKPGNNSFDIQVRYLSPDNMPRYSRAALIKEGEEVLLPEPALQSIYSIKNISSGQYQFILEIFEADGSTTRYVYKIYIQKFLWQQWWFWLILSGIVLGSIFYFINLKRKRQLAEQKVKTQEAELHSFKSEQEKKMANLQLIGLSNQFRPHFILNALNTIGAQMDDKPEAESVLSRLGESVNLIFNHSRQQKILHSFENEWRLVINIIHIHRMMYLKELETKLPESTVIDCVKNIQVPLGILQIPVENALLHGLSNREGAPWKLYITIAENENFITVNITDNGVGRKKSAILSNYTKHGTGTKNQNEIISIINASNTNKISITYQDEIYSNSSERYGTAVTITIPKQLTYGNG